MAVGTEKSPRALSDGKCSDDSSSDDATTTNNVKTNSAGCPTYHSADAHERSLKKKYWLIGGKYYDLTPYLDKHPGGREILLLARDRFEDCTYAFEAHHTDWRRVRKILACYEVSPAVTKVRKVGVQFPSLCEEEGFYCQIRDRVLKYLNANGGPGPTTECLITWWAVLFGFWFFYYKALSTGVIWFGIIQGIFGGWMGGFGHNWIHQPQYRVYALALDCLGLSSTSWYREHIFSHHMFTNSPMDNHWEGTEPFLVVDPGKPRNKCLKLIGRVLWPIVLMLGVYGNFIFHTVGLFTGMEQWCWGKLIFPIEFALLVNKWGFWWGFALNAAATCTVSLYYFTIALTNHNTEHAWDVEAIKNSRDWGERQMMISTDTAIGSTFLQSSIFLWLNYHTVHHLFPHTDMSKHPGIQRIILETCKEYNVRYSCMDFKDMLTQMMETFVEPRAFGYEMSQY